MQKLFVVGNTVRQNGPVSLLQSALLAQPRQRKPSHLLPHPDPAHVAPGVLQIWQTPAVHATPPPPKPQSRFVAHCRQVPAAQTKYRPH